MSDEIKEILSKMERLIVYGQYDAYYNLEKQILDYITNLQEEINLQEYNYQIMQEDITEVGKLLGLRDDFIISEEMPEKIKKLQQENERLREANERLKEELNKKPAILTYDYTSDVYEELENYKSRIDKAIEYIKNSLNNPQPFYEYIFGDEDGNVENLDKLLNILQGSDKE